jgi:ATP-dependent RNA helicase HelY
VLITLDQAGLLPAITFIFSRAGCEAAVSQCLSAGLWLTTTEERERIRAEVDRRCAAIPPEDLDVLGFWAWREALERGVAAHHAGLLPTFKEVVEELVAAGLVKAVFATETLALGINVPARSVVLEKLVKWNGETHAEVTPGEYTQLTGRAGRRGIDVEGHAVVLWQTGLDPEAVAGLASTRTYPLRSSFRPTYNMAVNLVDQVGRNRAREILETSFAQFQADRAVVGLSRQLLRHDEALAGYAEAMTCHLGDVAEYLGLRRAIAERESALSQRDAGERHTQAQQSLQQLRRGDVIRLPDGRRTGWAVVVEVGGPGRGAPLTVLTADRHVHRLTDNELTQVLSPLTRVPVPASFNLRSPQARRDLASTLRNALGAADHDRPGKRAKRRAAAADDTELSRLRSRMRAHPCHGCADREDHARWAERHARLMQEAATLRRRIDGRTSSIARTFDRVCELLDERGYLDGETVTPAGQRLKRIYGESDLLVAECLREGLWSGLDAAALAACVSAVVYSARGDDRGQTERQIPNPKLREVLAQTSLAWAGLEEAERRVGLDVTREIDLGLVVAMHRWARGQALERVLADDDLTAGDFVRWCRQVIDLLGQIHKAAADAPDGQALRATAQQAIEAVRRGVVAFSSVA